MMKHYFSLVFALLLLSILPRTASAAALEKINASYGAISGSMAQTWVAKEAKLFEKHGLDVNLVYISGGPRSIMSLIGGSVQFVNHSGMPALGSLPTRRGHRADRFADESVRAFAGGAEKHHQHRAAARQNPGHEHGRLVDGYSAARRTAA